MGRAALVLTLIACAAVPPAAAYVPSAEKISVAAAQTNRRARTTQALHVRVALHVGGAEIPAAKGELLSHPSGLVRLELRRRDGSIERHMLRGNEYLSARDGRMIQDAARILPPIFVLQARSGSGLRSSLSTLGVDVDTAVLGRSGESDCYVIGGRDPAAERLPGGRTPPSLWLDMEDFQAVRIDTASGVHFRFGPRAQFAKISLPSWVDVEQSGRPPFRLEILSAEPAGATSATFRTDWLLATPGPPGDFSPNP